MEFRRTGEGDLRAETLWPSCRARTRKLRTQPSVAPITMMVCLGWTEVDIIVLFVKVYLVGWKFEMLWSEIEKERKTLEMIVELNCEETKAMLSNFRVLIYVQ